MKAGKSDKGRILDEVIPVTGLVAGQRAAPADGGGEAVAGEPAGR